MFHSPRPLAAVALIGAAVLNVTAGAQTETAPADSAMVRVTPEMVEAAAIPRTPLEREVAAIRATYGTRLDELTGRYRAAPEAAAAAAAQREITALKAKLELDLLDLQLRLAQERQDAAAITELEQTRTAARARLVADTGLEVPAASVGGATR
jgi:hypothetical protein